MHLQVPATNQIDQRFPWFSSVLEQMLSLHTKSRVEMHVSDADRHNNDNLPQNTAHQTRSTFRHSAALRTQNSRQTPNSFPRCVPPQSPTAIFLPSSIPAFYFASSVPLPQGLASNAWEPPQQPFLNHPPGCNNGETAQHCKRRLSLSLAPSLSVLS